MWLIGNNLVLIFLLRSEATDEASLFHAASSQCKPVNIAAPASIRLHLLGCIVWKALSLPFVDSACLCFAPFLSSQFHGVLVSLRASEREGNVPALANGSLRAVFAPQVEMDAVASLSCDGRLLFPCYHPSCNCVSWTFKDDKLWWRTISEHRPETQQPPRWMQITITIVILGQPFVICRLNLKIRRYNSNWKPS